MIVHHQPAISNAFSLSSRELEVLRLLTDGLTNRQIAQQLSLSPETIKTHVRHIMEKLLVSDRTMAAVKALERGLLSTEQDRIC